MNIEVNNPTQLELPGVYKIINIVNNKYYIGSTKQAIRIRMNHHLQALRNNNHKNAHLQHAWNKYSEENFKFVVIENCEKNVVYDREQFYLDLRDLNLAYNINPKATGLTNNPDTLERLRIQRVQFQKDVSDYYQKLKQNLITLEQIPIKYHKTIKSHLNHIPWNKGKRYISTEHLKVKHNITEKVLLKCKKYSEQRREESDVIYVYDSNYCFIDVFRSSIDLANLSKFLQLPIKSRFKNKRGKCEINELQSCNINKAVKTGKPYKNLYFTNKPLHPGMDDVHEPKSVKNWNVNTEVNTKTKEVVSPYSIETEPVFTE